MPVDDQVVDDAAARIQHARVQGLARHLQLVHRVGQQAAQERLDLVTAKVDHGHVADVEHTRLAAHQMVLVELRAVVDGHVPTPEIDHLGAEGAVGIVEQRLLGHDRVRQQRKQESPLSQIGRPQACRSAAALQGAVCRLDLQRAALYRHHPHPAAGLQFRAADLPVRGVDADPALPTDDALLQRHHAPDQLLGTAVEQRRIAGPRPPTRTPPPATTGECH
ncbi:hypothetical protein G6F24_014676 [Rhizopus arrhizus]|nr:hypothetical protein G6F24_014676 [Rhizopus arrhizus]